MKCLKCGRETDQTFCDQCREQMDRCPVRPGTIIQLPKDRTAAYHRSGQNWHASVSMDDRLEAQRLTIRRLTRVVVGLAALVLIRGRGSSRLLSGETQPPVGQNDSAVTKATGDVTEPTTGADTTTGTTGMFHVKQ